MTGRLPRFVVDESSFDFRTLPVDEASAGLHGLVDLMDRVAGDGPPVLRSPLWDAVECLDGRQLYQVVYREVDVGLDRDGLLRLALAMDRCAEWSEPDGADLSVALTVDGVLADPAMSVALAHWSVRSRQALACLVFARSDSRRGPGSPPPARRGRLAVDHPVHGMQWIHFAADESDLPVFWRSVFEVEDVAEADFWGLAGGAFPGLVLAASLSFRRFEGSYSSLRRPVIAALSMINDHFAAAMTTGRGVPATVQALLGRYGVEVSPESVRTRGSSERMSARDVRHAGGIYRCEWHAKLEPHRNRIHFSGPHESLEGRIFIGIFVDHLPT